MTRARDTTRIVRATNYEGVSTADDFAVIDLSLIHISEPTRQAESRMPSSA